jgi:hypothetical protein
MTTDELLTGLQKIHATLRALELGGAVPVVGETSKPGLTVKQAFKKNEIISEV